MFRIVLLALALLLLLIFLFLAVLLPRRVGPARQAALSTASLSRSNAFLQCGRTERGNKALQIRRPSASLRIG
ncbi:MAG TPA: hypothetical protein VGL91_14270 [Acidobacteriota bacterium]|jgi:hypothetical protein